MMAFHQGAPATDPLAAAIAAAAALARNGGSFLYESTSNVPNVSSDREMTLSSTSPSRSPSQSPILVAGGSSNNGDSGEQDQRDDDENSGNHEDNDETNEEDAKRRMARSRERNREHARRTRRRKKAQLEALQSKVQSLQTKNKSLKQSLEECRIASILVGFSVSDGDDRDGMIQSLLDEANEIEGKEIFKRLVGGKRTRFVSDASDIANAGITTSVVSGNSVSVPLKIEINGQTTVIGGDGKSHLNWKTGVYTNENGVRSLLTNQQLEYLRRERNRMHAKMTRDRKKSFIAAIEKTIEELESSNERMNAVLTEVISSRKSSVSTESILLSSTRTSNNPQDVPLAKVTPSSSPAIVPNETWEHEVPEQMTLPIADSMERIHDTHGRSSANEFEVPSRKRICHGFSLSY